MLNLKHVLSGIFATVTLLGCSGSGDIKRLRVFSASDLSGAPDFRTPFTAPIVVVRHSLGYSSVSLFAQRAAVGSYVKGGKGEDLPVTLNIDMPKDLVGLSPKVHRSLALNTQHQFSGLLTDQINRKTALAFAKDVLAQTYCIGGSVTENHTAQYVDTTGTRPVARSLPMVSRKPPGGRFTPGWTVHLRCGLWSKPN